MKKALSRETASIALSALLFFAQCAKAANSASAEAQLESSSNMQLGPDRPAAIQQLVEKILDAYGGAEKLREIDSMCFRATGRIKEFSSISHAANDFSCTMISQGNKLRIEMTVMGQPLVTTYDGKQGWLQQGDQIFPADPATLQRIEGEIRHSLEHQLLAMVAPETKISVEGKKVINGKQCTVLTVTSPQDKPVTMFVDTESFLVSRMEFMGIDSEQGVSALITNDFLDYRDLFGTKEPFKIIEYTAGHKTTEAEQDTAVLEKPMPISYFQMPVENAPVRLEQGVVEIPFDYIYNQILIKAKVNGEKEATFIVDTGASQSMLDAKFASTVGTTQQSNYSVTTGSGSMKMNYLIADSLQLADLPLKNVAFGVTSGEAFSQMHTAKPDGLLGANVLKRFLITFDYRNRKIILANPLEVHVPAGSAVISTKPAMGNLGIVIDGTLDRSLKIPFLVDTGAAFNNVSASLLQPLVKERLLPVSKILGLDGQQVDVGAIKLARLQLGNLVIDSPVFSVAGSNSEDTPAGIITSKTLGILGNPLWSQFKLTIDYRHNRIFLEKAVEQDAIARIDEKLDEIDSRFRKEQDYDKAIADCRSALQSPAVQDYPATEALIRARIGALMVAQGKAQSKPDTVLASRKEFREAENVAANSRDPIIEGRICALLAREAGDLDPAMISSSKTLIAKAIRLAPMDPQVLTAIATALKKSNAPIVEKVIDQAISADPASWDALWLRYKLSQELHQPDKQKLVAAQLLRYYPEAPEVKALAENQKPISEKRTSPSPPPTGAPTDKARHSDAHTQIKHDLRYPNPKWRLSN